MKLTELQRLVKNGETDVFYRDGIIERWGSGTLNILDWCAENGNPAPSWKVQAGSVYLIFQPAALPDGQQPTAQVSAPVKKDNEIKILEDAVQQFEWLTAQVTAQVAAQVLLFCRKPRSAFEIMEMLGLKHRKTFRKNYLYPLL